MFDELKAGWQGIKKLPSSATEFTKEATSRVFGDNSYDIKNPFDPTYGKVANNSAVLSGGNNGGGGSTAPKDDTKAPGNITETPPTAGGDFLGSNTAGSAADLAYYDSQEGILRGMLGKSQNTLNQGLTNLSDSYNRETGNANLQRSRAMENFGVQREDMTNGKQEALGQVDTNARTLNDSLRRILGMASGSSSSAYQYAAPNAVARQASGQRNNVLSDYAGNERDLSLAENRATQDFGSLLEELSRKRNQEESDLRAGVIETDQNTNQSLADLAAKRAQAQGAGYATARAAQQPYAAAINSGQSQLDSLFERFRSPVLSTRQVDVQTPQLRDYMVDRAGINAANQGGQQQYSPYSNFLRKPDEEQMA